MYAVDTNLLVYGHNTDSPFHARAKAFLEKVEFPFLQVVNPLQET